MASISLRRKLTFGMTLPLGGLVLSMILLTLLVNVVRDRTRYCREECLALADAAHRMQFNAVQVQQFLSDVSATRGQDGLDDGFTLAAKSREEFLAGLAQFRREFQRAGRPGHGAELDRLAAAFEAYYATGVRMAHAFVDGGPAAGNKIMPEFDRAAVAMTGALEPFLKEQTDALAGALRMVEDRTRQLRDLVVAGGAIAIVATIALMVLISRSITGPIIGIVESLEASAAETASAAEELAGSSHQLAEGAVGQSAALDRSGLTLQAMSAATHQGVEQARQIGGLIHGTRLSADAGTSDLQALSTTMEEIRQSSGDIQAIIRSMDEIAFQTNILALNAAVEAARAGEAGAGFAVVAEEVRNLAQRSAAAAKESSAKIELAMSKAAQGKADNARVVQRIEEILGKVREVDGLMTNLSGATVKQGASIDEVVAAMKEIDRITHESAAAAEESASAAAELNGQAGSLRTAVQDLRALVLGVRAPVIDRPAPSHRIPARAARPEDAELFVG